MVINSLIKSQKFQKNSQLQKDMKLLMNWDENGIIRQINQLNLGQKIGLKQMMICVERMTPIAKLNLKLQC